MRVKLHTISDVKNFVATASNCAGPITIVQDRYVINAKSILGIMSLDLTNVLNVVIDNENDIPQFKQFEIKD